MTSWVGKKVYCFLLCIRLVSATSRARCMVVIHNEIWDVMCFFRVLKIVVHVADLASRSIV